MCVQLCSQTSVIKFSCSNSPHFTFADACRTMFLTSALNFSISAVCLAKKSKADRIVVLCKSVATGHSRMKGRHRLADKLEFIDWDPSIKQEVLYKEDKKVRSIRDQQIDTITRLRFSNNIHNKCPSLCHEP